MQRIKDAIGKIPRPGSAEDGAAAPSKFSQLPGPIRMVLLAGGAIGAIALFGSLLGFIGSLMENSPSQMGEPVMLELPARPLATDEGEVIDSESDRTRIWEQVKADRLTLDTTIRDLTERIRFSRAQRWMVHASQQCAAEGPTNCPSAYSWLRLQYRSRAAALQQKIREGRLSTDPESVDAIRKELSDLQDLSAALSLEIGGTAPQPTVHTGTLRDAIENFFMSISSFDSLRMNEALRVYEEGGQ